MPSISSILSTLPQQLSQNPKNASSALSQIFSPSRNTQNNTLGDTLTQILSRIDSDLQTGDKKKAQQNLVNLNNTLRRSFNPFNFSNTSRDDEKNNFFSSALSVSAAGNKNVASLLSKIQNSLQSGQSNSAFDSLASTFQPGSSGDALSEALLANLQKRLGSLGASYSASGTTANSLSGLLDITA